MNDWLHRLPVQWMALVMLMTVYLMAGAIFAIVMLLAKGDRARLLNGYRPVC